MNKKRNLLVLTPCYPDSQWLVIWDPFVKTKVDLISENFDKVYIFSPRPYWLEFLAYFFDIKPKLKNYKYKNIEIFYPNFFHLPIKYFREKIWSNQFKVVDDLIQKLNLKFDIIHSHFIWPSGYVWKKIKEKYGNKLIITGHWYDVYELPFRNSYWNNRIKDILRKADFITTVSKTNRSKLKKLWFSNIKIIPNWYNEDDFFYIENKKQLRLELNIKDNKKILLSVWNLVKQKNHKLLILACKELLKVRNDFICYIIWEWVLKKDLEKLINKNNLQNYVKLLWRKNHKDIAKYINISDLFILPSISESFWVVQVEAMACGVPVIATVNWWSEEIIKDNNLGFLLENNNDYKWLSDLINKWLEKKWEKDLIINYVKNNFSKKIIEKKYLEIY